MKKRIVCVLLTLIMLLSLVPMGASAATHKTSEAAITVLKQMTKFDNTCNYFAGEEFRIGYGTVCEGTHVFDKNGNPKTDPAEVIEKDPVTGKDKAVYYKEHTITEQKADQALRKALLSLDEKVNSFASANGLSLSQNQHDALVVFSFNAGADWMTGSGVVKSVIINKGGANELLNAMNLWTNNASLDRRKVEVNMYMNGIYSNTVSSSYGSVVYKANGGTMPQADYNDSTKYTYYFDLNVSAAHPVVPTRNGYKFVGWYVNSPSNRGWAPTLKSYLNYHTVTAEWQANNATTSDALVVNYQLNKSQLASLDVYSKVSNDAKDIHNEDTKKLAEELKWNSDLVWVDRDFIDASGNRWSRVKATKGWVKVGTAANNSTTDSYGTVIATATVTASGYLNLRQEAGTDSRIIGALAKNDTVDIYEIKTVNGHQWGRSKSGWLCLTYTRLLMKDNASVSDTGAMAFAFTGKYKGINDLKVFVEPNSNSNYAQYPVPHSSDPKKDDVKADLFIPKISATGVATEVVMTNMFKVGGELWVKATWQNPEWDWKTDKAADGKKDVKNSRSGWVKFSDIEMNPATFTVASATVNVRAYAGDASQLTFTLNKGVQVQVDKIDLVNENLWGHMVVKSGTQTGGEHKEGWVNLASKYFTRVDAPVIENTSTFDNLIATVINTDSLKVRSYGASYGARIGSLSRGTTVAVWESNEDDWYKVDSNQNGVYDYEDDGWVFGQYLDIREGTVGGNTTVTDSNGNKYETDGTGKGIIANTYSGVNVRSGPGTGYATKGKLLTGTIVDILETANAGKWGRVAQGWVSMDYVTMISYNEATTPSNSANGTTVESYDKAEKTTTTAVYPGDLSAGVTIYRTPDSVASEEIRTTTTNENVTMYELAVVTKTITSQEEEIAGGKTQVTTTTETTYWARINDGWVQNPDSCLKLNALDEKTHTQTGATKLNVRTSADETSAVKDVLVQGDQVNVTALEIKKDKVWGRIETAEGTGWIRLDYMSEGAVYVKKPAAQNTTTNNVLNNLGQTSSTGGFVNNTSGYRYTGKIIRANEVNVRATPSTAASKTTALKNGQALVIYETTIAENMAWGRCDAGWVYLYYVDLTPTVNGAVDARVVYNDNTVIYSDVNGSAVAGTYARMSTIDIYEVVGKMARTDLGWVNTDDLL